jgi:hypothetical protein
MERFKDFFQAFEVIGVPFKKDEKKQMRDLLKNGHSSKGICLAMWEEKNNLIKANEAGNFWPVLMDAITKWSWPEDDPRWEEYWERKGAQKRSQDKRDREDELCKLLGKDIMGSSQNATDCVYFIQADVGGPIKIGYSADVFKRLSSIQVGYPYKLEILLAIPGSRKDEKDLHKKLKAYHLRGEWFNPNPQVLKTIKELEGKFYR